MKACTGIRTSRERLGRRKKLLTSLSDVLGKESSLHKKKGLQAKWDSYQYLTQSSVQSDCEVRVHCSSNVKLCKLNTFHHSVINSLDFDSLTLISEQIAKPEQIVTGGSSNSLMITLKLLIFYF